MRWWGGEAVGWERRCGAVLGWWCGGVLVGAMQYCTWPSFDLRVLEVARTDEGLPGPARSNTRTQRLYPAKIWSPPGVNASE